MSGTRVHKRIMQTLRPRHVVARLSPNRKFHEPRSCLVINKKRIPCKIMSLLDRLSNVHFVVENPSHKPTVSFSAACPPLEFQSSRKFDWAGFEANYSSYCLCARVDLHQRNYPNYFSHSFSRIDRKLKIKN